MIYVCMYVCAYGHAEIRHKKKMYLSMYARDMQRFDIKKKVCTYVCTDMQSLDII